MVYDSRVFLHRENDTMDPGDLPDFFKSSFMKSRISNSATTDPVLPCESYFRGGFRGEGAAQVHVPPPGQWLQVWVNPYYFITCQSPFSRRFHHEGAHLGTNAWESLYNTIQYNTIQYKCVRITMGDFIWYQSSYNSNQSESNLRHLNFDPYPSRTRGGPWVTLVHVATHATMRMS